MLRDVDERVQKFQSFPFLMYLAATTVRFLKRPEFLGLQMQFLYQHQHQVSFVKKNQNKIMAARQKNGSTVPIPVRPAQF
mgnify:FL=1